MIVCHRHKFIFLKTRKTAGTSIEVALSRLCGERDIITVINPDDEAVRRELGYRGPQNFYVPLSAYGVRNWRKLVVRGKRATFYNHIPASEAKEYLGRAVWNSYYKFCFERNPWDRIVSAYFWTKHQLKNPSIRFEDYLKNPPRHVLSNYPVYSIDSRLAVDFVGRFESLVPDFQTVLRHLGISELLELPRLKAKARTDKRPYRELFTTEQRAYIEDRCRAEIELMGYRFDQEPQSTRGLLAHAGAGSSGGSSALH